jgi:hypothetical protein
VLRSGRPLPAATIVCVQVAPGISAIGWGDRQRIVAVEVAERTGHGRMAISQRETGRAVVKDACGPGGDGVATRARRSRGWESGGHMIRHRPADRCGANKNRLMAPVTIR